MVCKKSVCPPKRNPPFFVCLFLQVWGGLWVCFLLTPFNFVFSFPPLSPPTPVHDAQQHGVFLPLPLPLFSHLCSAIPFLFCTVPGNVISFVLLTPCLNSQPTPIGVLCSEEGVVEGPRGGGAVGRSMALFVPGAIPRALLARQVLCAAECALLLGGRVRGKSRALSLPPPAAGLLVH